MTIEQNQSLVAYNTFGIEAQADWLIRYESLEDLERLVRDEYFQEIRVLPIGAGSNLLFLTNFHGAILVSDINTIDKENETETQIVLHVGSGLLWDDLVAYTTSEGYWGIENLSLIPGTVGSASIQNIGAYGTEISQIVLAVHTLHRRSGQKRVFRAEECNYAYRHSIFKTEEYSDYIVTHVDLRLSKTAQPNLQYADLKEAFATNPTPNQKEIRDAVCRIREQKLPDYRTLGNAGSFFMNPIVSEDIFIRLKEQYPNLPHYPASEGMTKLSAGWLIDQAGLKGYRIGNVGVYERQALVLVNYGGATGQEVARLAEFVQNKVREQFGIDLVPEVRYIS